MAGKSKSAKIKDAIATLGTEGYTMIIPPDRYYCTECQKPKATINFYQSSHRFNADGILHICKGCLDKLHTELCIKTKEDRKLAMYLMTQELRMAWVEAIWEMCTNTNTKDFQVYIGKFNSLPQYSKLTIYDSDAYDDGSEDDESASEKRKYSDVWMGTFSKSELKYLDNYFKKLQEDFNIITHNHIDYARKIAKASMAMDKEYEKIIDGEGNATEYQKYKTIFDDLSKSAQFAESGRGKSLVGNGLTEVVDAVENKQWIYKKDEYEKDDIDLLLGQFGNISKSL